MKITRSFLRATVCGAALFSAGILTTTTNNAFAACGTGGQCSVNATGTTFTGGTYWATDWSFLSQPNGGPALHAVNPGSSINATNIIVQPRSFWFWTQGYSNYKAQAENGGSITLTDSNLSGGLNGLSATGNGSQITVTGGTINVINNAATVRGTSRLIFNGGVAIAVTGGSSVGVDAYDDADVRFDNATVSATGTNGYVIRAQHNSVLSVDGTNVIASGTSSQGLYAGDNAEVDLKNSNIEASGNSSKAVQARNSSAVSIENTNIVASGASSQGLRLFRDAKTTFKGGTIEASGTSSQGLYAGDNAEVDLKNSNIEASGVSAIAVHGGGRSDLSFNETAIVASNLNSRGLFLNENATANFENGTIEASGQDSSGIHVSGHSFLNLDDVSITAKGVAKGIVFGGGLGSPSSASAVNMTDSSIIASSQSTAIKSQGDFSDHWFNIKNSEISGGKLFNVQELARLNIDADNSVLTGFSYVGSTADLSVNLQNSLWTLRPDGSSAGVNSSVSRLNFANSLLRFDTPVGGVYQSLVVGNGNPGTRNVYNAGTQAHLEINTFVNAGGAPTNQFTDRLLVEGNVSGQTVMTIREVLGSTGAISSNSGTNAAHEGISLVQVSGTSRPDSFVIDGGYLTLKGKPYVHKLYAFGDGSAYGAADAGQRMVGGLNHWDYRLQNEFIRTSKGWAPQVVPQIASYLTAPTALFQASLMDTGNLQRRLGEMRHAALSEETGLEGENTAKMRGNFFLRGFGGDYNYHSNRNAIHYGYDADIRYAAVQAGGNLAGFDTSAGQMLFGLAGSYGDLSFAPDRFESRKTSMDVWTASAYASWLGNNGFYVDTILSYGGFSGDVSTNRYARTARLKGNSLTASVEVGQNFALGTEGWAFEPQAQLTYQRLSFDNQTDIDNFAVTLGSPEQWVGRIGGKLSKDLAVESVERLQLYGKLNLIHGFGDGDRVFLGDDFRIGKFGTNVEAGVGLNLDMTKNASLYGDVSYQGRISKGGTNGLSLNGGLRFQF